MEIHYSLEGIVQWQLHVLSVVHHSTGLPSLCAASSVGHCLLVTIAIDAFDPFPPELPTCALYLEKHNAFVSETAASREILVAGTMNAYGMLIVFSIGMIVLPVGGFFLSKGILFEGLCIIERSTYTHEASLVSREGRAPRD